MTRAVFADTFFWIALTNPADRFHRAAHELDLTGVLVVTTDEVLVELLTLFADDPWLRTKAARTAEALLVIQSSAWFPKAGSRSAPDCRSTKLVQTSATA